MTCLSCDGDGFAPTGGGSCQTCGGAGKVQARAHEHFCNQCEPHKGWHRCLKAKCTDVDRHCRKHSHYCEMCERWTAETECKQCGAPTRLAL